MNSKLLTSGLRAGGAVLTAASTVLALSSTAVADTSARPPGRVVVVQAVPQQDLTVRIDDKTVDSDSAVGAVLGPYTLTPGEHRVEFSDSSGNVRLASMIDVRSGVSSDVVVHLPAQVGGKPVVNSYRTPTTPIAPGKARVLIAHTATVAPADVRVDGKVVFHDIANGEYATADVAAGKHVVALLPAGRTKPAILGPLDVDLKAGTVTMVYAVGNPRTHSMNVIVHRADLESNGAVAPETIDTGSAGLAAGVHVRPFGNGTSAPRATDTVTTTATATAAGDDGGTSPLPMLVIAGLLASLAGLRVLGRRRRS